MNRIILLGVAALALAAAYEASADVLVMGDGRRIRGELISVNRGQVIFDEARPGSSRPRRLRVTKDEVARIVLRENTLEDDEDLDTMDDGPFGPGRDDDRDGPFGRERDRDPDRPFGRDRMITVAARRAWTDTGIDVRTGDVVRFAAEGTVLSGAGREDGPAGEINSPIDDRRPVPARPAGALIGRIGTSPLDVFFIGGDRGAFRVRASGRLYLGVNDHYHGDNSGSFEVRVSR